MVGFGECVPFLGVMSKPFSEVGGRGCVFHPGVQLRIFFFQAAGPETIHQYAIPVGSFGLVVGAFELYFASFHLDIRFMWFLLVVGIERLSSRKSPVPPLRSEEHTSE